MFDLDSAFSSNIIRDLVYSDELARVGIEDIGPFIKPALAAFLKEGIQEQIRACNLSRNACRDLLHALREEDFDIQIDENICPNATALPESFSSEVSISDDDFFENLNAEHQRALNYISWILPSTSYQDIIPNEFDQGSKFPLNLLSEIYGNSNLSQCDSEELRKAIFEAMDNALSTLSYFEEALIRREFQCDATEYFSWMTREDLQTDVLQWALQATVYQSRKRGLRKLRHPTRAKKLRAFMFYAELLVQNPGLSLSDIKSTYLHDESVDWNYDEPVHYFENRILCYLFEEDDPLRHEFDLISQTKNGNMIWLPWPKELLRKSAMAAFSECPEMSPNKAYLGILEKKEKFLLLVAEDQDCNEKYCLFDFAVIPMPAIGVDQKTLRNVCKMAEGVIADSFPPSLHNVLHEAEIQFCDILQNEVIAQEEKEFYKIYQQLAQQKISLSKSDEDFLHEKRLRAISIEDFDLSIRAFNCLNRAKIHTVGDILAMGSSYDEILDEGLMKVRNMGRKAAEEILDKLVAIGALSK